MDNNSPSGVVLSGGLQNSALMAMDTSAKEVQGGGVEWRVRVPQSSSVVVESQPWAWLAGIVLAVVSKAVGFGGKAWSVAADDPRRVVHGVKVGTGLTLVSLFYYTRPLYDGVGGWAMWAVMTVVVVFEYTVGEYDQSTDTCV